MAAKKRAVKKTGVAKKKRAIKRRACVQSAVRSQRCHKRTRHRGQEASGARKQWRSSSRSGALLMVASALRKSVRCVARLRRLDALLDRLN